jgi:TonB family protein
MGIFIALVMVIASQQSADAPPGPSKELPCHWSKDYVHWLSQLRPSSDKRTTGTAPKPPKKLRDVAPEYPQDTLGRHNLGGRPFVEAVINDKGKVLEARLVERIKWEPAWPEFDNAILSAVRKWEFEPMEVGGMTMWACMEMSIGIEWGSSDGSK